MTTVLVTGGNGFLGRYVTTELLTRGHQVAVLDTRYREPVEGATLVLGDVRDPTAVYEAAAHADGIIHLAGVLGTQETIDNPIPAVQTNIIGGLNVLEAAASYGLPMVNIAVGNWWMNNTYSISKNTVERFADMMNRYRGTRISVVRALNAYGPHQSAAAPFGPSKVRKVMPSFICRALTGQPIEIYGDGEQIMDMIYAGDVARILVQAWEHTVENDPVVVEAGTGNKTTINTIAAVVATEVERITGVMVPVHHLPMRPGEDERSVVVGDPRTLVSIGYTFQDLENLVSLSEGVMRTVAYFGKYLKVRVAAVA